MAELPGTKEISVPPPMSFSYRVFRQEPDVLLAVSDISILGKTFEEGGTQIFVSEDFYRDKLCDAAQAKELMKSATIVNAVGKEIVALMVKEKIVDKAAILVIDGVPHAQVVAMR